MIYKGEFDLHLKTIFPNRIKVMLLDLKIDFNNKRKFLNSYLLSEQSAI